MFNNKKMHGHLPDLGREWLVACTDVPPPSEKNQEKRRL